MGLFKNNSKPCPLCGEPTDLLFPKKVDDIAICKHCYNKIDVPAETLKGMKLEDLMNYMNFHKLNRALADIFTESYKYDVSSGTGAAVILDKTNKLLRFSEDSDKLVFRMDSVTSFQICEGDDVLFEGSPNGFMEHPSGALDYVQNMAIDIVKFNAEKAAYAQRLAEAEKAKARGEKPKTEFEPHFTKYPKFSAYNIIFKLKDHEYFSAYTLRATAPGFDNENPSIAQYTGEYNLKTKEMRALAAALMEGLWNITIKTEEAPAAAPEKPPVIVMNQKPAEPAPAPAPAAPPAAPSAPAPSVDIAEEIKKFKELLDLGAITQEEYDAKKKQLLGF